MTTWRCRCCGVLLPPPPEGSGCDPALSVCGECMDLGAQPPGKIVVWGEATEALAQAIDAEAERAEELGMEAALAGLTREQQQALLAAMEAREAQDALKKKQAQIVAQAYADWQAAEERRRERAS